MSKLYWGRVWARPDFDDGLWCYAKVRPPAWWVLRRLRLFLLIVWRPYEYSRLDWRTAWKVSDAAVGLGPVEIHRGPRPEKLP